MSDATPTRSPIGASVPNRRLPRLAAGRGRYVGDLRVPGMLHVAFLRSPHAHARIRHIDTAAVRSADGVVAVVTGAELQRHCTPFQGLHGLFPRLRAPLQWPLAVDKARWQGEPVAAVVARDRALAEDAAELIDVEWEPLPPVMAEAGPAPVPLHDAIPDNIATVESVGSGPPGSPFDGAAHVFSARFRFGRITGLTLEPRGLLADFDPVERRLTVHWSHQCPHQQQDLLARHLGLPEHHVRIVTPDVGGAFGLKQQMYGDEFAVCAIAVMLGRPVGYTADRLEALLSDTHARDHAVTARIALDGEGTVLGLDVDDVFEVGPYSQYPRSSIGEGNHVLRLTGAPYRIADYRARMTMRYASKAMIGHYRAVGQPVATAVGEAMIDLAAAELGLDPLELRRRNLIGPADCPRVTPGGIAIDDTALPACLDAIAAALDLPRLRAEQAALRERGILRGVGLAAFVELTASGPEYYGAGGQNVSAQEGCQVKLEPSGKARVWVSVTDQGQGIDTGIAQVVAATLGLDPADVQVISGDSETTPYGGGAWASRGIAIGGEAALHASEALRDNVLSLAGVVLQCPPDSLVLQDGAIRDRDGGRLRMRLSELCEIGYFRQHLLPPGVQPELAVMRHYAPPRGRSFITGEGVQAAIVEVDADTGIVRCLRHLVAHDSGVVVNPGLVDGQLRGAVAQGIGSALLEEIRYGPGGDMLTGSLADYLAPMADCLPPIEVLHVTGPRIAERLGAKGVGEAGLAGAPGAILNAVNDALAGTGASRLHDLPITPRNVLRALGRIP